MKFILKSWRKNDIKIILEKYFLRYIKYFFIKKIIIQFILGIIYRILSIFLLHDQPLQSEIIKT
jgi:hypothetical protein